MKDDILTRFYSQKELRLLVAMLKQYANTIANNRNIPQTSLMIKIAKTFHKKFSSITTKQLYNLPVNDIKILIKAHGNTLLMIEYYG